MAASFWRWQLHRLLVDRTKAARAFSQKSGTKKVLLLGECNEIANAQIFPFFQYRHELASLHGIEIRELPLRRFLDAGNPYPDTVDAVCFQTWFDLAAGELQELVERIKSTWPSARLAYFDWFAPTDLRYAEVLAPHIAAYMKKQVLKDFTRYNTATLGDTNLTDYYAKRFHIDLPETRFIVPADFERKLVLGSGFELSPNIIRQLQNRPRFSGRIIDIHARVAAKGADWYTMMRAEVEAAVDNLGNRFCIAHRGRISYGQYIKELRNSKLCISPFGYGEICWRDFEAMATGALLLKPDVSHLRLANDFFVPYETYVPLSWELDDIEEKMQYYLHHSGERDAIAARAFERLSRHVGQKKFIESIAPLWNLLGTDQCALRTEH
jgi:hypothetical protein